MISQRKNLIYLAVALFFLSVPLSHFAFASEITDGIKKTINDVIEIVKNDELNKDEKRDERRALLREIVSKKFSYAEMSRRTLTKHWNERTSEEKKEFINLFGNLLENSYANKLERYNNEKILFVEEKVKGNIAIVKTKIISENDEIPVNYKLIKIDNNWMIYDFIVEGVSMIRNYRAQFKKIIRQSSYQELVKKMKTKISNYNNRGAKSG